MWDDDHELQNKQLSASPSQSILQLYVYEGPRPLMHIPVWGAQESYMITLWQQTDMDEVFIWLDLVIMWLCSNVSYVFFPA